MGSERENSKREKERKMKIPIVLFVTWVASIKAASLMESFSEEQCPAHCCEYPTTQAPTPTADPTTDTTADPTTDTTGAPTTEAPTTEAPTTEAPTTEPKDAAANTDDSTDSTDSTEEPTTPDICSTCDLATCEEQGGGGGAGSASLSLLALLLPSVLARLL